MLIYTFDPTVNPAGTVLHITLIFQGGSEGTEEIKVPGKWAGQSLHAVANLRTLSKGTVMNDSGTPGIGTIRYPPHATVVIAYDLIKDWTGPFVSPLQFHPVLMPQYIEINGDNGLVHPKLEEQTPVITNFDWGKLPTSWALATSFGTSFGPEGRCQSYSGPWQAIENALFAAGEFRIHRFEIRNQPAVLAIRGQWTFTEDEAVTEIQKAVGIVRDFWHDYNFPYFLVTLIPYETGRGVSDGSAFTNAFWMYMSPPDSISALLPVLVHETFHTWDPDRMGYVPGDIEATLYWFTEGFAQYYEYFLTYRAGLMTLPDYIERTNGYLREFSRSSDPYLLGHVIALWLDGEIRKGSHNKRSLDDVMFAMVHNPPTQLTQARIVETISRYLSAGARREFGEVVKPGAKTPMPADGALGPCVHVSIDQVSVFDLGFDFKASMAAHRVIGVRQDGPAFKAGLRDGQALNGWSVVYDQPDRIATFRIQTAEGQKPIQYFPREAAPLPQYHLDQKAYSENPGACQKESTV